MDFSKWDPLESATTQSIEILSAAKKREIYNILKSYVGFYDPFCELLQNAMDAVDTRKRELGEKSYKKRICIRIDIQRNSVSVTDNGIGFNDEQFKTFLCPNVSFKDVTYTRGKKGVGATYLAYGFNYLQLGTKTADFAIIAELKDGRRWVDDKEGIVTRPMVTESAPVHEPFTRIDRGSTFTIRFGGGDTRPKDLHWVGATTAEQWKTALLIKTPLGHISIGNTESGNDEIVFDLEVVDKDGNVSTLSDQEAKYIFPHTVIKPTADLKRIKESQRDRLENGLDPSNIPSRYKNLNAVYSQWTNRELQELFDKDEQSQKELARTYDMTAYAFFCYSTSIWDEYNDRIAKLRKGTRILRGGLQLATNNMAQGELIPIPLTRNIGYQNQAHIIVHFNNADPDLGRKGFQPELKEAAELVSTKLVKTLTGWRRVLRKDTGAVPSIIDEGKLYDWIQMQEKHEKESPLGISNRNFFIPINEISITSTPCTEQDVIVLFNQLVAGGVVRGIRLMATSAHQQYDGVFRYFISEPLANHIFDKASNPLGVQELSHSAEYKSKPYVLEYKFNMDALIEEFENGEKSESEIDLVVAWEIGSEWKKRYDVTSLLDLDNLQHRPFHGVTHLLLDGTSGEKRFYAIILSELIEYLNDTEGIQSKQKAEYSKSI